MKQLLQKALDKWGVEKQLRLAQEELAELIVAISKLLRYSKPNSNKTTQLRSVNISTEEFNLIDELADVTIVLEQIKIILDPHDIGLLDKQINFKLKRLEKRIEAID